jgi:hypothetical protein
MLGVNAKVVVLPTVHLVLVLIMAVNFMLMVSRHMNPNNYPVYPEQTGEEDRPILPFSPV